MFSTKPERALTRPATSWTDLGYDWSRMGDSLARERPPFKVYLPRTTRGVVDAVREARRLGQRLVVRGGGHSSNDLVIAEDGALLLTQALDKVLEVDLAAGSATVQAGASVVEVDSVLARHGVGLEVVPDHAAITFGGYASVGGLSAASLHAGLFIDTVTAVEYVDDDGEVHQVGLSDGREALWQLLGACGRRGVITQLQVRVVPADKQRTMLRNHRRMFRDPTELASAAQTLFAAPGAAQFARAVFLDAQRDGRGVRGGNLSAYEPSRVGRRRAATAFGLLRLLGRASGVAPGGAGVAMKKVASAGLLVFPPKYARQTDVDRFSIGVVDWSVGDPSRMLVAFAPLEKLRPVFEGIYAAARRLRDDTHELTYLSFQFKALRSGFLAGGAPGQVYAEVFLVVGTEATPTASGVVRELAEAVDRVCLEHGAVRYMHTLSTHRGGAEERLLDPAGRYQAAPSVSSEGGVRER